MQIVQGSIIYSDCRLDVVGVKNLFSYKLHKLENAEPKQQSKCTPVLVVDFSWSMLNSQSAEPTLIAVKETCNKLFANSFESVALIFFGKTAHYFEVTKNNYMNVIDNKMRYYSNSNFFFETDGCFNPSGTLPEEAFKTLISEIKKTSEEQQTNTKYSIIFMTDGEFNGIKNYDTEWKKIVDDNMSNFKCEFEFHAIGYQNDHLKNIVEMKKYFDKCGNFHYYTINEPKDIIIKFKNIADLFESVKLAKIVLPNGDTITEDDAYFSNKLLFDTLEPKIIIDINNLEKSVSVEWLTQVLYLTFELGFKEQEASKKIKENLNSKNVYKDIVTELSQYYNNIPQRYLELRNAIKSIKSRNIVAWKNLSDQIQSFNSKFREIQELVSNELNEKKQFELATHIANSVSSRHLRTLQRRRINNDLNKHIDDDFNIECDEKEGRLMVVKEQHATLQTVDMISNKKDLDEYYVCFYTQDAWSNMLNSLIGIPIKYNWRELDDFAPSRANIESVSTAGFISQDGYHDIQAIFGGNNDHTMLYKNATYLKSAHDKTNAYLPIAIEPFFLAKINKVKERLGHMIAGSTYAFSNRHILMYVAVIRQIMYMMVDENTEKLKHILLLTLNTFRLLYSKLNCIYNKEQKPVIKSDIIYEIACGNTAPYLFGSCWESAIIALVTCDSDYQNALDRYNQEYKSSISMDEFRGQVWKMIYRHFMIIGFNADNKFEHPQTWNLPDQSQVKNKLENLLKTNNYDDAVLQILNDTMTTDKLSFKYDSKMPDYIKTALDKMVSNKTTIVFMEFLRLAENLNDNVYKQFNTSFMPMNLGYNTYITQQLNEQILKEIAFKTHWECALFGQKDCFPPKNESDLGKQIVHRINSNYGDQLKTVLDDAKELAEFKKKKHEIRGLPITFTNEMEYKINELFGDVFNNKISEIDFKKEMRSVLGKYAESQLDSALNEDNIDVLHILYNYCKDRVHAITVKPTKLPHSCSAYATSPKFLQKLTDAEFSAEFKPLGFGWSTKKYRDWVNDLHPYMMNNLYRQEEDFVTDTFNHIKLCNINAKENKYLPYVREFYKTFKPEVANTNNNSNNCEINKSA